MTKAEKKAYKMGYSDGELMGRVKARNEWYKEGREYGVSDGYREAFDVAHDWLMSHYREYFALRKPISEFENDFTMAMTTVHNG